MGWGRVANYRYDTHFGGVYYLYLRGMKGNNRSGVYFTDIDTEMLNRLDNLFTAPEGLSHV